MDYTLFFEKNDQISFALLQSFARSGRYIITQEEILRNLNVSEYKLSQVIINLNNDLTQLASPVGKASITSLDNRLYRGNNITTTLIHQVRLMYLERSSLFALFAYNLLAANKESKITFRKKNYISKTKFYAGQSEIQDILTHSNFYKSHSLIKSTEYMTRLKVFEFFYTVFNGIASPFPEMDVKVNNLIINIQSQFNFVIKPVQKIKLEIFMKIWLLRFINDCVIEESIIPEENISTETQHHLKSIGISINKSFNIELPKNELIYLYAFLVVQQYLPGVQEVFDRSHFPLPYQMTDNLIKIIYSKKELIKVEELDIKKISDSLNAINLRFFTFYVEPTSFICFKKIEYFKKNYPVFHMIADQFIQSLKLNKTLNLDQRELSSLYTDYIYTLCASISQALIYEKVHICVDFSEGPLYTDYIFDLLQTYNTGNLVLTRHLSAQTDIYLSDFYTSSVKQQQLVWRNPPQTQDWVLLENLVNNVRKKKIDGAIIDHAQTGIH